MSRNLPVAGEDLDRLVAIEKREVRRAKNGSETFEWVTAFDRVPAKVEQLSSSKILAADQMEVKFDYIVTIRFKAGLDEKNYRLIYLGRTLEITRFPKEIGRRQFQEILGLATSTPPVV